MTKVPVVIERFLDYIGINTASKLDHGGHHPSSPGQIDLAKQLQGELVINFGFRAHGGRLIILDDQSFLVHLPVTNGCNDKPHLAFAAHLDTFFDLPGQCLHPLIFGNNGQAINLPKNNTIITAKDLVGLEGKHIITSSGDTLLGADDKAGVAAMMTAIEEIINSNQPHCPLTFWFCVDEEIGALNPDLLPKEITSSWDALFTLDGENLDCIDTACFNGIDLKISFTGQNSHPGNGDKLNPANYCAIALAEYIRINFTSPMESSGTDGFVYVYAISGNASAAEILVDVRDFELELAVQNVSRIIDKANRLAIVHNLGCNHVKKLEYVNIDDAIGAGHNSLYINIARQAYETLGIVTRENSCRGGTDGGMLNLHFPNLPCPNLGTGARNIHSFNEFLVLEELVDLVKIIVKMTELATNFKDDASSNSGNI